MELNFECFMRCRMCDIWRSKNSDHALSTAEKAAVIERLREWLGPFHISFCGGESLMEKAQLCALARLCDGLGVTCDTTTSGLLLSEDVAGELMDSGLSQLNVSLDSLREEVHDRIRGRHGTFQRVTRSLASIANKPRRMRLTAWAIICDGNIGELVDMVHWAHDLGLDGFGFHALTARWAYGQHEAHSDGWFEEHEMWPRDPDAIERVLDELIALQAAGHRVLTHPEYLKKYKQYYRDPASVGLERGCFVGVKNLYITNDGDVKLCAVMPSVGNVRDRDVRAIWRSSEASERRGVIQGCSETCSIQGCNRRYSLVSQFHTYVKRFSPSPH
jgi:MoaA/NifB/PqqE/SkfB family radical SAM enzyme